MSFADSLDAPRLARLIDAGRGLLSDLDVDLVLDRLLETAADLTGARYVALGVLDQERRKLARFLTRGVDEAAARAIGELPRGRGILGVLIEDPRPLRLADIGEHPRSYGLPSGHPPMRTFLGVPVVIRGRAWGNLYLSEKAGGARFSAEDEATLVVLADWAAIAIEHAGLFQDVAARREELERVARRTEATALIARAVGGETELDRILELVVKRGRALVDAHDVLIMLRDGGDLVVAAGAGRVSVDARARLPLGGSTAGEVLAEGRARRVDDAARELRIPPARLGLDRATTALLVPLAFRGRGLGVLAAFDRVGGGAFTADDEQLLEAFAGQAAIAVATARSVEADRRRRALAAAEAERHRWARELHDETLQALGGLRVVLSSAARLEDPARMREAMQQAAEQLTGDIAALRSLIAELRPPALDELGLAPALASLTHRTASAHALDVRSDVALDEDRRLTPEVETTIYRVVQEALTNVVKHAQAASVDVGVRRRDDHIEIAVSDDGVGLDARAYETAGFGLAGMRERVELAGGELDLAPRAGGGTVVRARLPAR